MVLKHKGNILSKTMWWSQRDLNPCLSHDDAFGYLLTWSGVSRGDRSGPIPLHQLLRSRPHPFIGIVERTHQRIIPSWKSLLGPRLQIFEPFGSLRIHRFHDHLVRSCNRFLRSCWGIRRR